MISQFYSDLLLGIMVWGAGSLLQDGWATVTALLWTSLAAALALALLYRPLTLLALDDEQARRLGAPVGLLRLLVLLLAAGVTAQVVSRLGVISFAGLAGASVAHLLRVRAMGARFALSFLAGGLLLVVDSLLNIAGHFLGTLLPAGALCGVLGAPFLIFLVLRQGKSAQALRARRRRLRRHRASLPGAHRCSASPCCWRCSCCRKDLPPGRTAGAGIGRAS